MQYIQYGENNPELRRVYFHLVDATDGITPESGEAGGRPTISTNGRSAVNTVNTLVAVTAARGDYYLELAPSEIVNPCHLLLHYKTANTADFAQQVQVMAFDPYTQFGTLNGGAGADVDYKRIKQLIDEAVGSLPKPIEPKDFDPIPLSEGLQAVIQEIRNIKFPEQRETDLRPLLVKLEVMQQFLNNMKFPECDHSELLKRLDEQDLVIDANAEQLEWHVDKVLKPIKDVLSNDNEVVKREVNKLGQKIDDIQYVVVEKKPKAQPKTSVLDEYLNLDK